ncbi:Calx-beta domain-containing protein [Pseudoluteimonas lycopersici]|nr:Calx-beta domain-containing protein [Lysobacter lycopersici]
MLSSLKRRLALAILLSPAIFAANANNTAQTLPFSQDWSNTGLITTNDDWSGVPGIEGYLGQDITTSTGTDPQTLTGTSAAANDLSVLANQTSTSISNGDVIEFQITDPTIGFQGSGTADAPYLLINLDTSGQTGINVAYDLRDLDGTADNAVQPVALQYRVGNSGAFTNVPAGFVADATEGPSLSGKVTAVSAVLPADANNQPLLQVRIITTNAAGNDEIVGIDNISVTSGVVAQPSVSFGSTSAAEGDSGTKPFFFTISSNVAPTSDLNIGYMTVDGTATTADNDYVAKSGTATIAAGTTSVTISVDVNGDTTPEPNETFSVVVTNAGGAIIANGTGTGTINNDDVTVVPIHDIQGNGDASPLVGQTVTTRGIVTGRKSNGFFIQAADADADADPMTSEGVYVFTSSAPPAEAAVGNLVQVTATISEYSPTQDPLQPPLTELGFATVTLLSTGNALPTPVPLTTTFPNPEGAYDQLERVEGMRVSAASLTVVGPTDGTTNEPNATGASNGVFYATVTGDPRPFRTPGIQAPDPAPSGSIPPIPRWDTAPETMEVDSDAIGGAKLDLAAGAVVTGVTGPMDYGFRRYTILPEATPTVASTGEAVTAARLPSDDEFTVASYNLERFFDTVNDPAIGEPVLTPAAFANRLNKASLGIRDELHTPDVLAVMEMENLSTLQQLASKINSDAVAAGDEDPQYAAYLDEGNDVGGIDVGFLVKTAPVDGSTPRVEVVDVTQYGKDTTWIDPSDNSASLLNDRPPLLLRAIVHYADGRSFPVSAFAVHQRSLNGISDETVSGLTTAGDRVRKKRQAQAEYLAGLVQARETADPSEHLIVLGDFNAFDFNDGYVDPMGVVTGLPTPDDQTVVPGDGVDLVNPDLMNLHYLPEANKRYSYVFDGQAQSLDHILINQALGTDVAAYDLDHARMNADFPETNRNDANSPSRLSDHDPAIAYFAVQTVEHADLEMDVEATPSTVSVGRPVMVIGTVINRGPDDATNPGVGFAFDQALPDLQVSITPEGWSCDAPQISGGTTSVACNASTLAANTAATFTLQASAVATTLPGTLTAAAAATSETDDPDTSNNDFQDAVTVTPAPPQADLSVGLVRTGVASGPVANFSVPVHNAGPDAAQNVFVMIRGNGANPTTANPKGWICKRNQTYEIYCNRIDPMPAGTSETIRFSVITPRTAHLSFRAEVLSDAEDPNLNNNAADYTKP